MERQYKVLLGTASGRTFDHLSSILNSPEFTIIQTRDRRETIEKVFDEFPDLIFLDWTSPGFADPKICQELKQSDFLSHIPLVILIDEAAPELLNPEEATFEDFIALPGTPRSIVFRCRLTLLRAARELDANPLTKLPGNNCIVQEVERRMKVGDPFAFAFLDLDNFKAFNDRYGFRRGDEALRMTARVIVNSLQELNDPGRYVGHIGGDDFVFITSAGVIDDACERVAANFSQVIPSLYDDEDIRKGYIVSRDRRDRRTMFPLMTLSIAVIDLSDRRISHFGELSAIAGELKKQAKGREGNAIVKDKRMKAGSPRNRRVSSNRGMRGM